MRLRLINKILKKWRPGKQGCRKKVNKHEPNSPPPETQVIDQIVHAKKKRKVVTFKYQHVGPKVDTSPPHYDPRYMTRRLPEFEGRWKRTDRDNKELLLAIKKMHFSRGRVDSRWEESPKPVLWWYYNRVQFLKNVCRDNRLIYQRIVTQGPKVATTESLQRDWARNRHDIISRAQAQFVLFPVTPREILEDPAFRAPAGVRRPRVYLTLQMEGHSNIGELCVELFTDVCPLTCALFTELLKGDKSGFSYIGTHFFRKVPHLFWSGGDVTHDNGFGCYKQQNRRVPIGAENFHFSHSMPGLLSMSVSCNNEVCGIFNITFKPIPQFDLKNVVFGRVIRPSTIYDSISTLGGALSSRPAVLISSSRQIVKREWELGKPNTRIVKYSPRKSLEHAYSFHCQNGAVRTVRAK